MSSSEEIVEPVALTVAGKTEIAAFVCGKCKTVASSPTQFVGDDAVEAARLAARTHCGPWTCACGQPATRYQSTCNACWAKDANEREAKRNEVRLAQAKQVPLAEYTGEMVYDEDREAYLTDDAVLDARDESSLGEIIWGCSVTQLKLDAKDVIDSALEAGEHYEDAADGLEAGAEEALQELLDAWVTKYALRVATYFPDESIRIIVPPRETDDDDREMPHGHTPPAGVRAADIVVGTAEVYVRELPHIAKGARVRITREGNVCDGREGEVYDVIAEPAGGEAKVQLDGDAGGIWWPVASLVRLGGAS